VKRKTVVAEQGPQKLKYKATRERPKEQLDHAKPSDQGIKGSVDVSPVVEIEDLQHTVSESIHETEITQTSSSDHVPTESMDDPSQPVQLQTVVKSSQGTPKHVGGKQPPVR
jgi:hypothetical protein